MISDYAWNIENWIPKRLPLKRRTAITIAWLKACLSGVQSLAYQFNVKCQEWDFRVKYNSQQKVLASLLNKLFDPTSKRIRVETISDLTHPVVLYFDSEIPEASDIYFDSETDPEDDILTFISEDAAQKDFRVFVPTALSSSEEQIKAWIRRYILADKQYEIIYI